jgi:addiction module HigA family antidote
VVRNSFGKLAANLRVRGRARDERKFGRLSLKGFWPMAMHNPPHPGEIIREDCLKPLGLSVTAAAQWLGVSRQSFSELLNGHNGVSAEMAIRLEKAGWSNAETWLGVQAAYDLWHAKQRASSIHVKRYPPPDASAPV